MSEWPVPGDLEAPAPIVEPPADRYPFWGYRDLGFFCAIGIAAVIAANIIGAVLIIFWNSLAGAVVLATAVAYAGGLFALNLIARRYGQPFWEAYRWQLPPGSVGRWALAGLGAAIAAGLLGKVIGSPEMTDTPMGGLIATKLSLAAIGVLAVTAGPVVEELVFRGFLLPLLAKSLGGVAAVAITAAMFALPHLPQYGYAWQAFVQLGFIGACLGAARLYSGSTGASCVMHVAFNLLSFAALVSQMEVGNLPW